MMRSNDFYNYEVVLENGDIYVDTADSYDEATSKACRWAFSHSSQILSMKVEKNMANTFDNSNKGLFDEQTRYVRKTV